MCGPGAAAGGVPQAPTADRRAGDRVSFSIFFAVDLSRCERLHRVEMRFGRSLESECRHISLLVLRELRFLLHGCRDEKDLFLHLRCWNSGGQSPDGLSFLSGWQLPGWCVWLWWGRDLCTAAGRGAIWRNGDFRPAAGLSSDAAWFGLVLTAPRNWSTALSLRTAA